VKPSDRIIMLDKGEIIEEGPHRDLIARGGAYAALFSQQAA
jgi:ABC-type multidrug transport system fused ATPase/permease subunit